MSARRPLKSHVDAPPGTTNLYGERMTLCGLTGYETRLKLAPQDAPRETERKRLTALQWDNDAPTCLRCQHFKRGC